MKRQALLYACIIIVFIICGILYINNRLSLIDSPINELNSLEYEIEADIQAPIEADTSELNQEKIKEEVIKEEPIKEQPIKEEILMAVYICGAVNNPDVYTLKEGSRIKDVIDMAGGALEDADLNYLNLAEKVIDTQKIYVPKIGEEIDKSLLKVENREEQVSTINTSSSGLININTASARELQTLSGIGSVIAQNIIEYRQSNGSFRTIEEIKNVSRIGDKTFEKIRNNITVQ